MSERVKRLGSFFGAAQMQTCGGLKKKGAFSVTNMSQIKLAIDADNKPANLPSLNAIIEQCRRSKSDERGTPLTDESGDAPCAWVKFGRSVTMHEALTQQYVAQTLNDKADAAVRIPYVYLAFKSHSFGFIVTEYIHGSICDDSDAALVAAAVQSLITVQGPTTEPGPVGGGPIEHRFFVDWKSSITYKSVHELEAHINGVSVPLHLALSLFHIRWFPVDNFKHRFWSS
jgi:hypothetical protein